MKNKIILIAIVILSFVLRFYQLDQIPSGFHSDEAAFGYNAYSILLTGKDEYSAPLPLILRSFDDYKGAFYAYLAIPSIALLGLTEFAVRLPTAIIGVLFVFLSYLLSLRLTKDKKISILVSLLMAINPISIFLSRVQSDPLVSVFLVLLGFYCFLLWVENKHIYLILSSVILWIISIYTYPSPRVFLPILFISILFFYLKKISLSQKKILLIALALVVVIDFLVITGASQRLKQLSVFNAPVVTLPMEEKIREDAGGNVVITRSFHNKITDHLFVISKNYFDYFNYDFLFLKGGQPDREKIPGMGLLYIVELPFLLYGAYKVINNKEKWGRLVVLLILAFPLAISFAVDESPNVHRYYINIFFLELLVSYGIINFVSRFKKSSPLYFKSIIVIVIFIFAYNFSFFMHQFFIHQPLHQPWYRGYAYKELIGELTKVEKNYKKIVFTKEHSTPYIFLLFYKKYDPAVYQKLGSPRDFDNTGFDNYLFISKQCPITSHVDKYGKTIVNGEKDTLYINSGNCPDIETKVKNLKTIYWKDKNPAFKLIEFTN